MTEDLLCPECGARLHEHETPGIGTVFIGHADGCSHIPKLGPGPFKRERRDPDRAAWKVERARQDREARTLRDLRAPVEVRERCSLHPTEPASDCRPCELAWEQAQERRAVFGGPL